MTPAFIDGDWAALDRGPPVQCHRPAANVLFTSAARTFGAGTTGVLLTGMGDDGADGLCEIRTSGGFTIANGLHFCEQNRMNVSTHAIPVLMLTVEGGDSRSCLRSNGARTTTFARASIRT
jgi:chemotaxis response regulator CheB